MGFASLSPSNELMIEPLKGRDGWALARLCIDHMQFSKSDYLARIAGDETQKLALRIRRDHDARRSRFRKA